MSSANKKSVVVVVRRPPLGTIKAAESLRVALGQTLSANQVTAAFIDDGAWCAAPLRPDPEGGAEFEKPIGLLHELGHRLVADSDSLEARGITSVAPGVEVKPRRGVIALLTEADTVIVY